MASATPSLAANLDILQVSPEVAAKILEHQPAGCRIEASAGQDPRLLYRDQSIYAGDQPVAAAVAQADELIGSQKPDLVIFFGFGLGWHLQRIRRLTSAPIIVLEPSLDLAAFVLARVAVDLPDLYLVNDEPALADLLGSLLGGGNAAVLAGAVPAYVDLFAPQFARFRETAANFLEDRRIADATQDRFALEWVSNLAANLPFLARHKPLACLGDRFVGKPAMIVGAGPSLDHNFSALKQARGHALVIAAHTAVIPLSRQGITPDLVVILEGQKLDHFFDGVPDLDQMVLLPAAHTHPAHLELGFKGLLGLSVEGIAAADWMQEAHGVSPLPVGGSVACAAYSLAHALGCDPLVCVGMDLAYADGRSHALGTDLGCCDAVTDEANGVTRTSCREGFHRDLEYVTTMTTAWGGQERVATRNSWAAFRHWFEAAARTWLKDHRLLNANGGGARIRGFTEMPLTEVIAEYCRAPLATADLIAEAMAAAADTDPVAFCGAVRGELATIDQAVETAGRAADLAGKAIQRLDAGHLTQVQPLLDALAKQEQRLRELSRQTRLLNTLVGVRVRDLAAENAGGDDVEQTRHSLAQSRRISEMVREGGKELTDLFEPALAAVSLKRESS